MPVKNKSKSYRTPQQIEAMGKAVRANWLKRKQTLHVARGAQQKKVAAPKKPRALSGYTYFGQQNKDEFNEEMNKMDEKPKFVSFVGKKWKALSKEEQEEWNLKAKEAFEANNQ